MRLPFKGGKHQLGFANWSAKKDRHIGKARWWRFGYQIGYVPVERTINDQTKRALRWIMRGNEEDGAPEIRIE